MSVLDKSHDRIQVICEKIRLETLAPAKCEAEQIIANAKEEAERIKELARQEAEQIHTHTKEQLEIEKQIFSSSLEQATKQTVELLKQKIETTLFNPALESWVHSQMGGAKNHAKLIDTLIKAIDASGLKTDLAIKIPQAFSAEEIVAHIDAKILETVKKGSVEVADIKSGVKISLKDKKMSLDLSENAIKELVASFVRKDFRKFFFAS